MAYLLIFIISVFSALYAETNHTDDHHLKKTNKEFAIQLFNDTWTLLDNQNRSEDDNALMINSAHASLYHWKKCGNAENEYIGEWQISRVYSVLNMFEPALYHAKRALYICEKNKFEGFNLAYAYEAMARAYLISKDKELFVTYSQKALSESKKIKDKADLELLLSDLKTIVP